MADCELLAGCLFFNDKMQDQPATVALMKERYCKGNNNDCARYLVFKALGRENVPPDLFPSQTSRAENIIAEA